VGVGLAGFHSSILEYKTRVDASDPLVPNQAIKLLYITRYSGFQGSIAGLSPGNGRQMRVQ